MSDAIAYWDRETQTVKTEDVYAEGFLRFAYDHPVGRMVQRYCFSRPWFTSLYGCYKQSKRSVAAIPGDIVKYGIPMHEYEEKDYANYSEFFLRMFKPGMRPFVSDEGMMPAFAEGKYVAYASVDDSVQFPVKGKFLNVRELLQNDDVANAFIGGPLMVCRLCPVDYHHFHFPDDGTSFSRYRVHGHYHSVNVIALRKKPDVFLTNERVISILDTVHFGRLAYIEVGAMCVGKIIQTHTGTQFSRGEKKGHFDFGASTVIVLGEKGRWNPSSDILEHTSLGHETKVKLGTAIASRM